MQCTDILEGAKKYLKHNACLRMGDTISRQFMFIEA